MTNGNSWPALPLDEWRDTYDTLHMWTQVIGKVCLALAPPANHFWNIAFQVTSRGLVTPLLPYHNRSFNCTFDFIDHELRIQCTDGPMRAIPLRPQTVAAFYGQTMAALEDLGIHVKIWTRPVEFPDPIPFERDEVHHSYDPAYANAHWRALLSMKPVLESFRCGFIGKCSPVHFFWGSFDLAVTRFSGKKAPERPVADPVTKEAYSHEVISHGFWPGSGPVQEPAFYAYASPEPAGLKEASVLPEAAFYHRELNEFILPYEAVRGSSNPQAELDAFLRTTYDQAATLAGWNREELEREKL